MERKTGNVFWTSLAFVAGFSLAFTLLGAGATTIGKFLFANKVILTRVAGGLVIILGLHMAGVFRIP